MKVALVHDYIKEYGGAERVLEALHELYPEATVFTTVFLPEYLGPHKDRFKTWKIKTSFLQYLPFKSKLISPLRLLSPLAFRVFDFSGFDLIIVSSTGAYFPNSLKKQKALQICYCHTPPRYLYGYKTARDLRQNPLLNSLAQMVNHFLRILDGRLSENVDYYLANSKEVAVRIKKFYRREAEVIYPPVVTSGRGKDKIKAEGDYFVTGGRLARAKHIDLVIKACSQKDLRLKVFGRSFAGYGKELEKLRAGKWFKTGGKKYPLIELLGEVSESEKKELLRGAKAGIFAYEDEDFGILPVEVMSYGVPVVAYRSGGLKETVVEGKTGVFFNELKTESLADAISRFEQYKFDSKLIQKHAEKFDTKHFKHKLSQFVEKVYKK